MTLRAVGASTPGRVSRSSAEALLMFMGPLVLRPSKTPWATALASRVAAAVAAAVSCRMASGLRLAGEQPMTASSAKVQRMARFISVSMRSRGLGVAEAEFMGDSPILSGNKETRVATGASLHSRVESVTGVIYDGREQGR